MSGGGSWPLLERRVMTAMTGSAPRLSAAFARAVAIEGLVLVSVTIRNRSPATIPR
jgi:hypothetical protein